MSETQITNVPHPLVWTDPGRMSGTPCFNRTRVPVQTLFDYIESGLPLAEFLDDFPDVSREHAIALLRVAEASAIQSFAAKEAAE